MTALVLALVTAQALPSVFTLNGAAWEALDPEAEVTLERRPLEGSPYFEYRASASSAVPLEELCARLFEFASVKPHGELKARKLLTDGPSERVVYDQVAIPIVSNRDYAMTVRRTAPGAPACRISFWASNDTAPKRPDGYVRIDKLWGAWELDRVEGKTVAHYSLFSDPGGSIPSFVVHSSQRRAVIDTLRSGLKAAEAGK